MSAEMTDHKVDRAGWPAGPWDNEPDRVEWRSEIGGYPCLIVRSRFMGNLCGYVGIGPKHPLHGVDYGQESDVLKEALERRVQEPVGSTMAAMLAMLSGEARPTPDLCLTVHGGLTYAAGCQGAICHLPAEGEDDNIWWFGFDCAHAYDDYPRNSCREADSTYRDIAFVRGEVESLARQLAALEVAQ